MTSPADLATEVIELRRYRMVPGRRDDLIELFEREFVETQEAFGIRVIGTFRDPEHPDTFVWLRGFADMATRYQALTAFYGGSVWAEHRVAANATMLDSDDNLLLRPAPGSAGFGALPETAPFDGDTDGEGVWIAVRRLTEAIAPGQVKRFQQRAGPIHGDAGLELAALLVSDPSPNTVRSLPIREDVTAMVSVIRAGNGTDLEGGRRELAADHRWRDLLSTELDPLTVGAPEDLTLLPTARSRLRG